MISIENLSLTYSQTNTVALKDINLKVSEGELIYILGESGAGKSTLIKVLMGILTPNNGSVIIDNLAINSKTSESIKLLLRRNIGPIFQDFRLFCGRSVLDNVLLSLRIFKNITKKDTQDAKDLLHEIGLSRKITHQVENLSFGERQRVAIARAIVRKPKIILADEPTGNLDQENAKQIFMLLQNLKDESTTVIITTHATHLIGSTPQRIVKLENGIIEYDGSLKEVSH